MKKLLFLSVFIVPYAFASDDKLTKDARLIISCTELGMGQICAYQIGLKYAKKCGDANGVNFDTCFNEKRDLLIKRVEELKEQEVKKLMSETPASE